MTLNRKSEVTQIGMKTLPDMGFPVTTGKQIWKIHLQDSSDTRVKLQSGRHLLSCLWPRLFAPASALESGTFQNLKGKASLLHGMLSSFYPPPSAKTVFSVFIC
jgi:hypothetical protein